MKIFIIISCALLRLTLAGSCVAYNASNEYYIASNKFNNSQANASCISMHSRLAIVRSQSLQDFLVRDVKNQSHHQSTDAYYIGLIRTGPNKADFMWDDGEPLTYTIWAYGEPSYGRKSEYCVTIGRLKHTDPKFKWNDAGCLVIAKYICHRRIAPLTTTPIYTTTIYTTSQSPSSTKATAANTSGQSIPIIVAVIVVVVIIAIIITLVFLKRRKNRVEKPRDANVGCDLGGGTTNVTGAAPSVYAFANETTETTYECAAQVPEQPVYAAVNERNKTRKNNNPTTDVYASVQKSNTKTTTPSNHDNTYATTSTDQDFMTSSDVYSVLDKTR